MKNSEFKYETMVEFGDTDLAGIVHFPNYFKYMENCEHAFFRSLGYSIHGKDTKYGWPRINCECKFNHPLFFEDKILVHLMIEELDKKRIQYVFDIFKVNDASQKVARGRIKVCCVKFEQGRLESTDMPADIFSKLKIHEDIQ